METEIDHRGGLGGLVFGRGPTGRAMWLAGRGRTFCGHQNQRPSSAAIDGVISERTINVSNSRPRPIVVGGQAVDGVAARVGGG